MYLILFCEQRVGGRINIRLLAMDSTKNVQTLSFVNYYSLSMLDYFCSFVPHLPAC